MNNRDLHVYQYICCKSDVLHVLLIEDFSISLYIPKGLISTTVFKAGSADMNSGNYIPYQPGFYSTIAPWWNPSITDTLIHVHIHMKLGPNSEASLFLF